jgi:hypothetical protein
MDINKFDVIVWVRKTGSFPALRNELLRLAGNEPDESTSYEGMVDFHWGFVDLVAAEHVAAALKRILDTAFRYSFNLTLTSLWS